MKETDEASVSQPKQANGAKEGCLSDLHVAVPNGPNLKL